MLYQRKLLAQQDFENFEFLGRTPNAQNTSASLPANMASKRLSIDAALIVAEPCTGISVRDCADDRKGRKGIPG